jgi:hypothetical protein
MSRWAGAFTVTERYRHLQKAKVKAILQVLSCKEVSTCQIL